jgi:hypothetical protein
VAYQQAAERRGPAFGVSMLCVVLLAGGGAWGIIKSMS